MDDPLAARGLFLSSVVLFGNWVYLGCIIVTLKIGTEITVWNNCQISIMYFEIIFIDDLPP
jgi:hypothetical protein